MGYHTDFSGSLQIDRPLTKEEIAYINRFAGSRRMARNKSVVEKFPDPLREAVGLPIGPQGAYFVGTEEQDAETIKPGDPRYPSDEHMELRFPGRPKIEKDSWRQREMEPVCAGQRHDASVLDYNKAPLHQPGLWCQWVVNETGTELLWDEGEKFYCYVEWLEYLISHFFEKWGVKLNGEISWQGDESDDRGTIFVKDNVVEALKDSIRRRKPSWEKR
jgi:hypothetical protein